MTLKNCTKDELIFVIERLSSYCGPSGGYYLERALSEVRMKRVEKQSAEAERLSNYAYEKCQEYIDLLAPYDGRSFGDIPIAVLEKASAAMDEAQEADRKWNKLMGIS